MGSEELTILFEHIQILSDGYLTDLQKTRKLGNRDLSVSLEKFDYLGTALFRKQFFSPLHVLFSL